MASEIFQDGFTSVDSVLTHYVTDTAAALMSTLQGSFYTLLLVYMALWGFSMMRGMIQEPVMDAAVRMVRLSIIVSLATNAGIYAGYVYDFLYNWPAELLGALQGGAAQNTAQLLDQMLDKGIGLAGQVWQTAGLDNIGGYFQGAILWLVACVVTVIAAGLIIMAKMTLAVSLALGPLFIFGLVFEATRQYFDRWIGIAMTAGLTILLVGMSAGLAFKLVGAGFDAGQLQADGNGGVVTLKTMTPAFIYGLVAVFVMLGMPAIAGGLGGGVSTASAAAVGWAWGNIKGARREVRQARHDARDRRRERERRQDRAAKQGGGGGGRFGPGQANSVGAPMAVYRRITTPRQRKAA